jgi:hypothetical protein
MDDYADKAKARMIGQAMNRAAAENELDQEMAQARARMVKRKSGGRISASSRADGIAQRGKTRGKIL